jgi:hypothetical protein
MAAWFVGGNFSMKVFVTAAAFAAGLAASVSIAHSGTDSAFLLGVTGKVLVNTGNGFQTVQPAITIQSGYDIFLAEGASATIHFNEANCEVTLSDARVTHITGPSMCTQAAVPKSGLQTMRGSETEDVVVTPTNGTYVTVAPAVAGEISPYFIAASIFAINSLAFIDSVLLERKETPTSAL